VEGTRIEFRWGKEFPRLSRLALGPIQPPVRWVRGLFPGGGAVGVWRQPPLPQSSAEVKERVKSYLSPPLWTFSACYRVKFTFAVLWCIFTRIFPPPAFLPSCTRPFRSVSCSHILSAVLSNFISPQILPFLSCMAIFEVGFRGRHLKMEEYKVDISEINPAYVN
jgi:hypothetical protein